MKITVICKNTEWQIEKLSEAAEKLGVTLQVTDIPAPGILPDHLGDIVIWRSSSLGGGPKRAEAMKTILEQCPIINRCLAHIPQATEKIFQQEYVSKNTKRIPGIPTLHFHSVIEREAAIQSGILRYPFVQKPNKGSKGEGVELIRNASDLELFTQNIDQQVYQNFIQNSGDYRVFILGGRMLGAIKRTPQKGSFLNNISQGGKAETVTDPKILSELRRIGTTIASIFELTLCGVDIVFDEETRNFVFLEVNTVPQWKGFQEATGIDVAKEIILYCQRIVKRKTSTSLPDLITEEYRSQSHLLGEKKFHLLSRLFLWSEDITLHDQLEKLREKYLGISDDDSKKKLTETFTRTPEHGSRMIAKEAREIYFQKYPQLEPYLNLLFKHLFAREIYKKDIRHIIQKLVSDDELIQLKVVLENDEDAMRILSTHAINYLYLLHSYLGIDASRPNPEKYFRIGCVPVHESPDLQLYFFTHCIIGASHFYSTKINPATLNIYTQMLRATETILYDHFQKVSLDNKFEFLVCAKMCDYQSSLEKSILAEAERSLAPDGNFLIDTENETAALHERNDFVGAEHRNVLYIMSQTPFHPHTTKQIR